MAKIFATLLAFFVTAPALSGGQSAHQFDFTSIDGGTLSLSQYKGKAVLVVNTASFCGFTPQYEGLQTLWETYQHRGLVILGVPSNDFGQQEPGSSAEIKDFCSTNYQVSFAMTEKEVVSGANAHPFYKWARAELGYLAAPKWNFHKYLLDPEGRLVDWFSTATKPNADKLIRAVEKVLP